MPMPFSTEMVCVSDKINNETLILFYLQKGLITNEQKPVINYHFNVIPPQSMAEDGRLLGLWGTGAVDRWWLW